VSAVRVSRPSSTSSPRLNTRRRTGSTGAKRPTAGRASAWSSPPDQEEDLGRGEERTDRQAGDPCSWRPDQFVRPAGIARYALDLYSSFNLRPRSLCAVTRVDRLAFCLRRAVPKFTSQIQYLAIM
jgi:hypothetical protein